MDHRLSPFRRLAVSAFFTVLVAVAPARAAENPSADKTLETFAVIEPAAGATLLGGQTAVLRWEAGSGLARAVGVEEWEAFLSFDGGRTFPQRITPHVGLDRRSVLWQVPNVPSSEARLLFRFGNEREEREVLLPLAFRIERGQEPAWTPHRPGVGEPARAGAAGVVAWSEGDRTGRGWREVEAAPLDADLAGAHAPQVRSETHDQACERAAGPASLTPPSAARFEPVPPSAPRRAASATSPATADILLLIQRRNE